MPVPPFSNRRVSMRNRQHFLIAGLGALTLCCGTALALAQDQGQQPSPEQTAPESVPQSMPPEQSNMEDQMLTRGESQRSSEDQDQTSASQSASNEGRVGQRLAQIEPTPPRSSAIPQPVYPQQTEDSLSQAA